MFLSLVKLFPSPGTEHTIIDVLDSLKGPVATIADCLACLVTVEAVEGGAVCYLEQWRTREALDRHLRSALYGRVLEAMELSHVPPEVVFYEVIEISGFELIEQARSPL